VLRFDGADVKDPGQSMESYLTREWASGLKFSDTESITINGMDAATGSASISGEQGQRNVRLVAIRFASDQIFRFLFITPPDQTTSFNEDFRRTTFSFRRLSTAEAATLKPRRVRVVTVRSGDTPEIFAQQMAFDDFQLERFRVLNGLKPGDALAPGQRVKVISE
jgi:predicted Zn-dependent protease